MSTLDAIDRAIDGLCPCGGQPREGSIYCGPDCEPTHLTAGTDRNGPGRVSRRHGVATPMRWRPDLVVEVDDTDLTPVGRPQRLRRFTRTTYSRNGTTRLHLRLDDGIRFVGCDIEYWDWRNPAEREAAWRRLEEELTDPSRVVADDTEVVDEVDDLHFFGAAGELFVWFGLADLPPHLAANVIRALLCGEDPPAREAPSREVPRWQRLCPSCHRRGEPQAAQILTYQGGVALRTEESIDEQMCPHCWYIYPPPALRGEVRESSAFDGVTLRVTDQRGRVGATRIVSRRALECVRRPRSWFELLWDRLNEDAVRSYHHANGAPEST